MIYGIKTVAKYLLGKDIAGRNFAVYPGDTFIVSYPRSGNTWTRFLVANLLHPEETVTFANVERLVPDTSSQSNRALKRTPRPRTIKTHEYFDARYKKVLYIVRDPRDVALSYYDFQRKYRQIEDAFPLERYVSDFVRGKLISWGWGTWGENVGSWLAARGRDPNFLLVRYEDMIADTVRELGRIATFLGASADKDRLTAIVAACSAEKMRELEKKESDQWVATKGRRNDIPFVRTATSGGWKTALPAACVREIEAEWGDLMQRLGYPLSAAPEAVPAPALAERKL